MKTLQCIFEQGKGWRHECDGLMYPQAQLVFVFGNRELIKQTTQIQYLMEQFPNASIVGCSTSGEIYGKEVVNASIVATAVWFEKSTIQVVSETIHNMEDSFNVGVKLINQLEKENLKHVFVLSEGLNINGSELAKGLNSTLSPNVAVTGGLAGDEALFKETVVLNNGPGKINQIVAIGFYGPYLEIGHGSMGGWESFGVDREITKSKANILYELDNQPALELYKKYLGSHAEQLPASALLFPLSLRMKSMEMPLVRTVLSINEQDGSMIFAGDLPQGEIVRLMNANYDKLIEGANDAAERSVSQLIHKEPDLAILISCVGRKLVLKLRTDEELESVSDQLGAAVRLTGFYSYGELCPSQASSYKCDLHNQTMTITTFKEF